MTAQAPVSFFDAASQAQGNRSFVRRVVDAFIASRRRKAEEFVGEYVRSHRDSLPAHVKSELKRHRDSSC
jgi:hypothetical protein